MKSARGGRVAKAGKAVGHVIKKSFSRVKGFFGRISRRRRRRKSRDKRRHSKRSSRRLSTRTSSYRQRRRDRTRYKSRNRRHRSSSKTNKRRQHTPTSRPATKRRSSKPTTQPKNAENGDKSVSLTSKSRGADTLASKSQGSDTSAVKPQTSQGSFVSAESTMKMSSQGSSGRLSPQSQPSKGGRSSQASDGSLSPQSQPSKGGRTISSQASDGSLSPQPQPSTGGGVISSQDSSGSLSPQPQPSTGSRARHFGGRVADSVFQGAVGGVVGSLVEKAMQDKQDTGVGKENTQAASPVAPAKGSHEGGNSNSHPQNPAGNDAANTAGIGALEGTSSGRHPLLSRSSVLKAPGSSVTGSFNSAISGEQGQPQRASNLKTVTSSLAAPGEGVLTSGRHIFRCYATLEEEDPVQTSSEKKAQRSRG
ncbi:serine/arginine repetitive matrix protein 3-like isoform X2 [Amphibalanus amphitrite]|nr:serine/arginine repetitive matrix protein 3-like isoform X2 [Amphibalanus amphitrite]